MGLRTSHLELVNLGARYCGWATNDNDRWQYKSFKMADLGSQNLKGPLKVESGFQTAKELFTSFGIEHVSFDITGKYGAVKCDLGVELQDHWGKYDLVANFATSEHVEDEYNCFKNIHHFCKVDGPMVHAIPREDSWPGHCYHYYNAQFFENLAVACGYQLLFTREVTKHGAGNDAVYIEVQTPGEKGSQINMHSLMIKSYDNDFITREQFNNLRS